jgi:precorrin-6A/cobalt-precorrin-6A reductase
MVRDAPGVQAVILLLGGTSETAPIALGLAGRGYRILVSTATDAPLEIGHHPNIGRRTGRLDEEGMAELIEERGIRAIVDATHPYASMARTTARRVARSLQIPYLTLIRPGSVHREGPVAFASDHKEAARMAFSRGETVLLTIGSRNLGPYAEEGRRTGGRFVVRVLSHPDSIEACRRHGIKEDSIIAGRGPFSLKENRAMIRRYGVGMLVTKDSGTAGGVEAKLEAAHEEGCQVVIVKRPEHPEEGAYEKVEDLIYAVSVAVSGG